MNIFVPVVALALALMACESKSDAQESDISEIQRLMELMDQAERKAYERKRRERVAFMSLETMFPDPRVRALAEAAGNGDIAKIDEIVDAGVDVNARGTSNATPLFWAFGNADGFRRLLELGADPNAIYDDGGTIMQWVVLNEEDIFLKLALRFGGDPNLVSPSTTRAPIFEAMGPGFGSKVPILLEAGADMNSRNMLDETPMMVAAKLGQFDIIYDLLERGADYRTRDQNNKTLMDKIALKRRFMDPENDLTRWMEKVIAWLAEHGEEIPAWKDPAKQ